MTKRKQAEILLDKINESNENVKDLYSIIKECESGIRDLGYKTKYTPDGKIIIKDLGVIKRSTNGMIHHPDCAYMRHKEAHSIIGYYLTNYSFNNKMPKCCREDLFDMLRRNTENIGEYWKDVFNKDGFSEIRKLWMEDD